MHANTLPHIIKGRHLVYIFCLYLLHSIDIIYIFQWKERRYALKVKGFINILTLKKVFRVKKPLPFISRSKMSPPQPVSAARIGAAVLLLQLFCQQLYALPSPTATPTPQPTARPAPEGDPSPVPSPLAGANPDPSADPEVDYFGIKTRSKRFMDA